jgi:hypothetical protein
MTLMLYRRGAEGAVGFGDNLSVRNEHPSAPSASLRFHPNASD